VTLTALVIDAGGRLFQVVWSVQSRRNFAGLLQSGQAEPVRFAFQRNFSRPDVAVAGMQRSLR